MESQNFALDLIFGIMLDPDHCSTEVATSTTSSVPKYEDIRCHNKAQYQREVNCVSETVNKSTPHSVSSSLIDSSSTASAIDKEIGGSVNEGDNPFSKDAAPHIQGSPITFQNINAPTTQDISSACAKDTADQSTLAPSAQGITALAMDMTATKIIAIPSDRSPSAIDAHGTALPSIHSIATISAQNTATQTAQSTIAPDTQNTANQGALAPTTQDTTALAIQGASAAIDMTAAKITPAPSARGTFMLDAHGTALPSIRGIAMPSAQSTAASTVQSTATPTVQSTATPSVQSTITPDADQSTPAPTTQDTTALAIQGSELAFDMATTKITPAPSARYSRF